MLRMSARCCAETRGSRTMPSNPRAIPTAAAVTCERLMRVSPSERRPWKPASLRDDTPGVARGATESNGRSGVSCGAGAVPARLRPGADRVPRPDCIQLPGLVNRRERVRAAAAEFQTGARDEIDDGSRDEDLAALRQLRDARADVHDDAVGNAGDHVALAGVETEVDVQPRCARLGADRAAAPDRTRRSVEDDEDAPFFDSNRAA